LQEGAVVIIDAITRFESVQRQTGEDFVHVDLNHDIDQEFVFNVDF